MSSRALDASAVARMRLRAQCVVASTARTPAELVARLVAVQAQDYLGALWAVGLRVPGTREPDVERALAERAIVRTWPMRGTLHFVAAHDVRALVGLLAPRAVAAARGRLEKLGLDGATFARAERALVRALSGGRALTRGALYAALERAAISTAGQRGIHILWRLAQEQLVCFGPRAGKQHTFVLLDEWLGAAPAPVRPREEALAELAARYVAGHGPATAADLAWWSGLTLSDAARALAAATPRLMEREVAGRRHFVTPEMEPVAPQKRAPGAELLPAFDEFLVAFADRSAALDPSLVRRVNAGGGILHPTVVAGARVCGTWKRSFARVAAAARASARARPAVAFDYAPFAPWEPATERAIRQAEARYAAFLALPVASSNAEG